MGVGVPVCIRVLTTSIGTVTPWLMQQHIPPAKKYRHASDPDTAVASNSWTSPDPGIACILHLFSCAALAREGACLSILLPVMHCWSAPYALLHCGIRGQGGAGDLRLRRDARASVRCE